MPTRQVPAEPAHRPRGHGFDVETHKLVASALGVEACFVSPTFSEVTAGNWGDRFDLAYASGAINATRMEHLWMTQPYYYVPQRFIVRKDSPATELSDLDGKKIGTCTSCTVEAYLQGTLKIPGVDLVQKVKEPKLAGYETEFPGIDDLAAGKIDAFLAAEPVGLRAIKDGQPLRLLEEPAFSMYPSGFVDKGSSLAEAAFVARVNDIIRAAHADGTLKSMSMQWFGADYTTAAGEFDLGAAGPGCEVRRGMRSRRPRPDRSPRWSPAGRAGVRASTPRRPTRRSTPPSAAARRRPIRRPTSSPRSRRAARSSCGPTPTTRRNPSPSMGATRLAVTKCAPNQMTAPRSRGYDAETGKLVAAALGVEPCFVATPFDAMIAGAGATAGMSPGARVRSRSTGCSGST